jgi:arylsulfatase A-like enzyme
VEGLYTEEELHHIRMLYAEKVTMVDKWFGWLMDRVRQMGLDENTMVMVVSDHGSPMGNGKHGHGIMRKCRPWPYEELAHVPLLMRGPGLPKGKRVEGFVQSCDVAPTVVDWLGIGIHPSMQGESLLPLARGEVDKVRDFAIAGYFRYSWSIITKDWSYIHWLKEDEKTVGDARYGIYGQDLGPSTAHILEAKKTAEVVDRDTAFLTRAYEDYKKAATLDGEDPWTCTVASSSEVPERDELYDRRTDPFQLNNIASVHPEKARELLDELRSFMAELKAS